ncbi:hypothetical protein [Microbacterium sp. NPDC056569]|uniref:hypothetical protein n=1 Tax=Microbacterium sp. NPDC056569 TaxID=3345867 RepID=UPI00366B975D
MLVVARDDDGIVGFGLGRPLAADPQWQQLLVRAATSVVLGLFAVASAARAFYAELGFHAVGSIVISGDRRLDLLAR